MHVSIGNISLCFIVEVLDPEDSCSEYVLVEQENQEDALLSSSIKRPQPGTDVAWQEATVTALRSGVVL